MFWANAIGRSTIKGSVRRSPMKELDLGARTELGNNGDNSMYQYWITQCNCMAISSETIVKQSSTTMVISYVIV